MSIASNVAEGHNRRSRLAYRNHVAIALGSLAELETQIELGRRLKFVDEESYSHLQNISGQVGRLLHGLARALERNSIA